eukprot:916609-Rhodomonas_salina.5
MGVGSGFPRDSLVSEQAASEHVARIETPAPIPVSTWTDLPDDKLGPVAMTDEVRVRSACYQPISSL